MGQIDPGIFNQSKNMRTYRNNFARHDLILSIESI